jgi:L-asparagine transporter-like permease
MRSSIGGLCFDIMQLGRSFVAFRVEWAWDANSVAHRCASMVSAMEHSQFWLDYFPEWLLGLAAADILYSCL